MRQNNSRLKKIAAIHLSPFDWKASLKTCGLDHDASTVYALEISRFLKYLKSIHRAVSISNYSLYKSFAAKKNCDLNQISSAINWYFCTALEFAQSEIKSVFIDNQIICDESDIPKIKEETTVPASLPLPTTQKIPLNGNWKKKLVAAFKSTKVKESTQNTYARWINKLADWSVKNNKNFETISDDDVYEFIEYLNSHSNLGTKTIESSLCSFSFLFKEVFGKKLNKRESELRQEIQKKQIHVLSVRESQRVINKMSRPNRVIGQLIFELGLRPSELLNLRVRDIDLQRHEVVLRNHKGEELRRLQFSQETKNMLHEHIQAHHKMFVDDRKSGVVFDLDNENGNHNGSQSLSSWEHYWVFPSKKTQRDENTKKVFRAHINDTSIQSIVRTAAKSAGIAASTTPYSLRNSHALHLLSQNDNAEHIQIRMGFSNEEAAETYIESIKQSLPWRRIQKFA